MKRNTLTAWLLGIILIFSATSCFNGPIVKGSKNYITQHHLPARLLLPHRDLRFGQYRRTPGNKSKRKNIEYKI